MRRSTHGRRAVRLDGAGQVRLLGAEHDRVGRESLLPQILAGLDVVQPQHLPTGGPVRRLGHEQVASQGAEAIGVGLAEIGHLDGDAVGSAEGLRIGDVAFRVHLDQVDVLARRRRGGCASRHDSASTGRGR